MLHKCALLFLFTSGIVQASAIPQSKSEGLQARGNNESPLAVLLDSRAPPPKTPPKTPPKAPAQPAKPDPAAGKPPVFPQLPVPYREEATDLCDIYIDCGDEEDDTPPNVKARRSLHDYRSLYDNLEDDHVTLSKRARLSSPKLPGGALALTALGYPSSGELYSSPRQNNPKEVYDFKDNKLGTTAVSKFTTLVKPSVEYATEHIIELQTLGMFMLYATKADKTLDAFFRNKFVKPVPGPLTVAKRPNPPPYKLGTDPPRDSLMRLVFEAMGSTINPTDFVLCEAAINSYKMRVWSLKEPMGGGVYDLALADAMSGAVPSADFLSALRLTFGVYNYLNSPSVVAHTKNINTNIRLELANAGALYNEPKIALVPVWDAFMKTHFQAMDTAAKKWATARLPKTKSEIAAAIKKYTTLADTLKKAETGKDAGKHAADQKKKQTALESTLTKQKADVAAAQKKVDDAKKVRATKPKPAGADKKVGDAKKALLKAEKEVGKTQRKIHELYSYSVNLLVKNLGKDSQRVTNFEKDLVGLKLTAP